MICLNCYRQDSKPKTVHAGSAVVELFLYLFSMPLLCIPGMIYSHWRVKNGSKICRSCGGAMIADDSPRGREITNKIKS